MGIKSVLLSFQWVEKFLARWPGFPERDSSNKKKKKKKCILTLTHCCLPCGLDWSWWQFPSIRTATDKAAQFQQKLLRLILLSFNRQPQSLFRDKPRGVKSKVWSRSEYVYTDFTHWQGFPPFKFLPSQSIQLHCFQVLCPLFSDIKPVLNWVNVCSRT